METPRVGLTPQDYVTAAVAFVDEHGLAALTMRSLGEVLGVDPTAVYRHFTNKEALIAAALDALMVEILDAVGPMPDDPRRALFSLALTARQVFERHPGLAGALAAGSGDSPHQVNATSLVVSQLERLGLSGNVLVEWAQALEGFVIGTTVFDLLGAPEHFEIRRARHRRLEHPAFDAHTRSADDVRAFSQSAFERGLRALIDAAAASAATSRSASP